MSRLSIDMYVSSNSGNTLFPTFASLVISIPSKHNPIRFATILLRLTFDGHMACQEIEHSEVDKGGYKPKSPVDSSQPPRDGSF